MPKSSGASNRAKKEEGQRARLAEANQTDLRLANLPPEEAEQVRLMLDLRAAGITPEAAAVAEASPATRAPRAAARKKTSEAKRRR